MLTHEKHVTQTQLKRQRALEAIRARFRAQEEAESVARAIIIARREQIAEQRMERDRIARIALREKIAGAEKRFYEDVADNPIALTLDEVFALNPCRRISAVRRMLRKYWDEHTPVTAQQALDLGCTMEDIKWVMNKLKWDYMENNHELPNTE